MELFYAIVFVVLVFALLCTLAFGFWLTLD